MTKREKITNKILEAARTEGKLNGIEMSLFIQEFVIPEEVKDKFIDVNGYEETNAKVALFLAEKIKDNLITWKSLFSMDSKDTPMKPMIREQYGDMCVFECGSCGTRIGYVDEECPACKQKQNWDYIRNIYKEKK